MKRKTTASGAEPGRNPLARMIDHTFLKPNGTPADIARLCRESRTHGFASVCVHPCEVARCARLLKGSGVKVCTVVGFPLGQNTPGTIAFEALDALQNGADELDFVVNVPELKEEYRRLNSTFQTGGRLGTTAPTFQTSQTLHWRGILVKVREAKPSAVTKLIIECCYLTDEEKVFACKMAKAAGFDFVKTSTGFGTGGATVHDVALMRKAVGPGMGVKAAGGIRSRGDAEALVAAGATRLGCSSGVAIVEGR